MPEQVKMGDLNAKKRRNPAG